MNIFYFKLSYNFSYDVYILIQFLLSNTLFLFLALLTLSILFLLLSIYFHNNNKLFISSIFIGLFIAFIQIIITVFIIERIIERYEENRWEKTKILINEIVKVEIQDDLTGIVYTMDFSDGRRPHNYIEGRLEEYQKLTKV